MKKNKKRTTKKATAKKATAKQENRVVFAIRLIPAERRAIHAAAGPRGATRFVLAAALAAAKGDRKAFDLLAQQPRWAMEYTVSEVVEAEVEDNRDVVYIGEGTQVGYLPDAAAEALGW